MARLVTKFKYLKPGRKKSAGGYAKYIATREGVELIDESKTDVMSVISDYQKKGKILDIKLEEISTEEVIKKIYEGEADEYEKVSGTYEGGDNSGIAI